MSEVQRFWCHDASNIRCVRESDFDAEHALRLAGDHQVEQLREQLAELVAALETSHSALAALACLAPQHRTEVIDQAIDQAAFTLSHAKAHPINSDKGIRG